MKGAAVKPVGDSALSVIFDQEISDRVRERVASADALLRTLPNVIETVPAYASILVYYDALQTGFAEMAAAIENAETDAAEAKGTGRRIEIPVCYGGVFGEDLADVAAHAAMSEAEVIRVHSEAEYPVYFIGFLPGFPYLGGLDERIHTPRRKTPRTSVPAGAVAIGGAQTGVYPSASPGGWNLIGQTPIRLFDETSGSLLHAGDIVKFTPIGSAEYRALLEEADRGKL